MVRRCGDEVWENPTTNPRLFSPIRRQSPECKALYAKRQAIERSFKSLKQSRRNGTAFGASARSDSTAL